MRNGGRIYELPQLRNRVRLGAFTVDGGTARRATGNVLPRGDLKRLAAAYRCKKMQPAAVAGNWQITAASTATDRCRPKSLARLSLVKPGSRLRNRRLQVRTLLGVLFLIQPLRGSRRPFAVAWVQRRPIFSPRRGLGHGPRFPKPTGVCRSTATGGNPRHRAAGWGKQDSTVESTAPHRCPRP